MPNTRSQTLANAREFSRDRRYKRYGMCLQWSREMAGIPVKYPDAITAARHAPRKMGTPPPGTFVYWRNRGAGTHGHIAISAGDGDVYSTDFKVRNRVDRVSINAISRGWYMEYIGWSDECNDMRLRAAPQPAQALASTPRGKVRISGELYRDVRYVSLFWLLKARKGGYVSRHVFWVQTWLKRLGFYKAPRDGKWDPDTQAAYDAFRRSIRYRDADAVGAPGWSSLQTLAKKAKTVKPVREGR